MKLVWQAVVIELNLCGSVCKDGLETSAAVKVEVNQESGKVVLSAAN